MPCAMCSTHVCAGKAKRFVSKTASPEKTSGDVSFIAHAGIISIHAAQRSFPQRFFQHPRHQSGRGASAGSLRQSHRNYLRAFIRAGPCASQLFSGSGTHHGASRPLAHADPGTASACAGPGFRRDSGNLDAETPFRFCSGLSALEQEPVARSLPCASIFRCVRTETNAGALAEYYYGSARIFAISFSLKCRPPFAPASSPTAGSTAIAAAQPASSAICGSRRKARPVWQNRARFPGLPARRECWSWRVNATHSIGMKMWTSSSSSATRKMGPFAQVVFT